MAQLWEKIFPDALHPKQLTSRQMKFCALYVLKPAGDRNRWSEQRFYVAELLKRYLAKRPHLKKDSHWQPYNNWVNYKPYSWWNRPYDGSVDQYIEALLQYERLFRKESERRRKAYGEDKKSQSSLYWSAERQRRHNKRKWREKSKKR